MKNYSLAAGSKKNTFPCLVYHRLHEEGAEIPPHLQPFSINIGKFRQHLNALNNAGFRTITPENLCDWQKGKRPNNLPILITFDDGWASNLMLAHRELSRHRMHWILFAVSDTKAELFAEGGNIDRPLQDKEIARLANEGVTIGAHGVSHRPFTELSVYDLCFELMESRRRLEDIANRPVDWLASPFGLSNKKVDNAVRMSGYRFYASGLAGETVISYDNMLQIRRIGVNPLWSGEQLLAALSPKSIARAARRQNIKRRLRLMLGYKRAEKLRRIIRRRSHDSD